MAALPSVCTEPLVHIVRGKQGRTNATKPSHELLELHKNIPMDEEFLMPFEIEEISAKVLDMARKYSGHRFDTEYMEANGGAYGISTITIDASNNVHAYTAPLYRPTSHGGHVLFRTGKEIENVLKITHSDVPVQEAGSKTLGLYVAKFKNYNCLLIVPDTFDTPELFRALELEKKGDGTDTTTLVTMKLCDGLGLGRSPPHVSIGKFKFLFPGVERDISQVKKKRSHVEGPGAAAPVQVVEEDDVWTVLNSMVAKSAALAGSDDATNVLYRTAKHFLRTFDRMMGREEFNKVFKNFTRLPDELVIDTVGNKDIIAGIIEKNVNCKLRHAMFLSVNDFQRWT